MTTGTPLLRSDQHGGLHYALPPHVTALCGDQVTEGPIPRFGRPCGKCQLERKLHLRKAAMSRTLRGALG